MSARTAQALLWTALTFTLAPCSGAAQIPTDTLHGAVSGTIRGRFQGHVTRLGFAVVQAVAPGFRASVVADSTGAYTLTRLPRGAVRLEVTHPGHDRVSLEVVVPAGGSLTVDVELAAHPVELNPVEVSRSARLSDPAASGGDADAEARVEAVALASGPGVGLPGLVEAVRGLPGNDPANPTDVLFMRGSTTDLKLVLLNGAPVFTPFHTAGLLESFEPSILDRATLHVGGAPARYDGGLTYILDLATRRPTRDRLRASGAVDLLSASLGIDTPLGSRAGLLLSGRTLHNIGDGPLGGVSPYGYSDAFAGFEVEPTQNHLITAMGFWNRETVVLDYGAPSSGAPDQGARWSNRAAALTYHARFGDIDADVTVAGGGYDATLPLLPGQTEDDPTPQPLLATARTARGRIVAELARSSQAGTGRIGISLETQQARYRASPLLTSGASASNRAEARAGGVFIDVTRVLGPAVTTRFGLRADGLTGAGGGARLAPRAAITWTVGPRAYLTLAAGRYHQHARATDVEVERSLTDVVTEATGELDLLPVATADHVVMSLDQTFGERTRLGVEGYWKGYQGLGAPGAAPIRSSGLDLRLRSSGETTTFWIGYSLSWFWSNHGLGSTSAFTGRHLLSAGLSGTLLGPVTGAARVAYGAGLPYTAIPFGSVADAALPNGPGDTRETLDGTPPLAGGLDESFLRVDLEVHASLEPEWGGRRWRIRPYLRILNALDRRDALFYTFQPWRDEAVRPLAQRPLLPVIGVAWTF